MLGSLTMKLVLLVCVTVPIALASRWSLCPLSSNTSTLIPEGIFSEIACATQCDYVVGCNAISWTRTPLNCKLMIGPLRLGPYPTSLLSSLFVRTKSDCVKNVSNAILTYQNVVKNCLADATSFAASCPPCRAFALPNGGAYQSSQPLSSKPEWWYPLNQSYIISHVRLGQALANQTLAMYVLDTLNSPRDTNSLCFLQQTTVVTGVLLDFNCGQYLVGKVVLLTRATAGWLTMWGMEIYGLPLFSSVCKKMLLNPAVVTSILGVITGLFLKHNVPKMLRNSFEVFGMAFAATSFFAVGLRLAAPKQDACQIQRYKFAVTALLIGIKWQNIIEVSPGLRS